MGRFSFVCVLALLFACGGDGEKGGERGGDDGRKDGGGSGMSGEDAGMGGDGGCAGANPCDDNADCAADGADVTCTCKDGFTGDGMTCTDVDECATGNPCGDNATCTNNEGGFECQCAPLFGDAGDGCKPLCEIALADEETCSSDGALCEILEGEGTCRRCDSSHVGDGVTCQFDPMCEALGCADNASCEANGAGRACLCPSGYSGDGVSACDNIDECDDGTHTCDPATSDCIDTDGSFVCACKEGFDGKDCINVNECEDASLNDCDEFATCIDKAPGFECACAAPFVGDDPKACACDLTGWWGMRSVVTTTWPVVDDVLKLIAAGEYTTTTWELRRFKHEDGKVVMEQRGCGSAPLANGKPSTPDLYSCFLAETYSSYVPEEVWDDFDLFAGKTVELKTAQPGKAFDTPQEVALLGLDLDDPLNDTWPANRAAVSTWDDVDGDGVPGLTLWPRGPEDTPQDPDAGGDSCPGLVTDWDEYSYVAVRTTMDAPITATHRSTCVSGAVRVISHLEGEIDACDTITGMAINDSAEGRVHSCKLASSVDLATNVSCKKADWDGMTDCTEADADFLDSREQQQTSAGTFELKRLSADFDATGIDCDTVRTMLPPL